MARQHSFWAGALGFIGVPIVGGIAVRLLSNPSDSATAAEVKAGAPHALLAGASYWAMKRYPSNRSFFLGATIGEALAMITAPAMASYAKSQAGVTPAPTTNMAPMTIQAAANALPPATPSERIKSTVAKVLNGYAFGR